MNPKRAKLAELMDGTVTNRDNWHYALTRPQGGGVTEWQALHGYVLADCSAGIGILAKLAGIDNPLGPNPFNGIGNTGTSYQDRKHDIVLNAKDLQVGDIIIYGLEWATHHMSMVRYPGPDPLIWSNGWWMAPEYTRLSTQSRHQPAPATFFRIMPPDTAPTPPKPVDMFWVWLRWYLGEGEFRDFGRQNPKMRPKVPKKISAVWWARQRKFIQNRHKLYGNG